MLNQEFHMYDLKQLKSESLEVFFDCFTIVLDVSLK